MGPDVLDTLNGKLCRFVLCLLLLPVMLSLPFVI
jgi:hypothetical protein